MHNPVHRRPIDFGQSPDAAFRFELNERLRGMQKVALHLGFLSMLTL